MSGLAEPGYGATVPGGDDRIVWIRGLRLAWNGGEIVIGIMPGAGNMAVTSINDSEARSSFAGIVGWPRP